MRLIPERPVSSCGEAKRATNPQMGVVGSRGRGAHTIVRCKVGTVHGSLYLANGCSNGERHWGDLLVSAVGPTIQDGTELHHNTVQNRGLSVRGSTMQALGRCRRDAIPPAEGQFFLSRMANRVWAGSEGLGPAATSVHQIRKHLHAQHKQHSRRPH